MDLTLFFHAIFRQIIPTFLTLSLLGSVSQATENESCDLKKSKSVVQYEVGLVANVFLAPPSLEDFDEGASAFGLVGAIPLGPIAWVNQVSFGSSQSISNWLFESAFRAYFTLPFLTPFTQVGLHNHQYARLNVGHDQFGVNVGIGLLLPMRANYRWTLGMKILFEGGQTLSTFGGSFTVVL